MWTLRQEEFARQRLLVSVAFVRNMVAESDAPLKDVKRRRRGKPVCVWHMEAGNDAAKLDVSGWLAVKARFAFRTVVEFVVCRQIAKSSRKEERTFVSSMEEENDAATKSWRAM